MPSKLLNKMLIIYIRIFKQAFILDTSFILHGGSHKTKQTSIAAAEKVELDLTSL